MGKLVVLARNLPEGDDMTLRTTPKLFLLLCLLTLGACYQARFYVPRQSEEQVLLEERARYTNEFRKVQAKVAWENKGPRFYDFDHGTVIARDWRLLGLPGREYVRLWFTYDNSTNKTFDRARVWMSVHDPKGKTVSSRWLDIAIPYYDFTPGNTYTTEIRVPTKGVHREAGWSWTVGCSAHERKNVMAPVPPYGRADI